MKNSRDIGDKTEGILLGHLVRLGRTVLIPFGTHRYDLVEDRDGVFIRGQCKTGRLRSGSVEFNSCSVSWITNKKRGYHNEADVFWVYCPDNDKIYEVPVKEVGATTVRLRIDPLSSMAPKSRIRWAADYQI